VHHTASDLDIHHLNITSMRTHKHAASTRGWVDGHNGKGKPSLLKSAGQQWNNGGYLSLLRPALNQRA
jgi:hypothetical protein